ncbi:uncharacterized protein VTP21DRAFT_8848 [Calcarisporiella thermophila]|uniref:uncharacterized protein n=1 Tax=Calcarisporiella thermophila TaxID=911321 RepID=UPI0037441AEE
MISRGIVFTVISCALLFGSMGFAQRQSQQLSSNCLISQVQHAMQLDIQKVLSSSSKILRQDTKEYAAANKYWSDLSQLNPTLIVQPTSAEGVQQVLRYVKNNNIDFVIKSGGHSCNPGYSGLNGGLQIDLGLLNNITYNDKSKTVVFGPGARWGEVDKYLIKFNRTTVGGHVSNVGVAGFILGGGYGWKTGQHNLASDVLVEAEVVLASGEIVRASERENTDLFFAIRGGGNQFGVVTKFELKTFPQDGPVTTGFLFYTKDQVEELSKLVYNWLENNKDPKANLMLIFAKPPPNFEPAPIILIWYDGAKEQAKQIFKEFYAINSTVDTTAEMDYATGNTVQDEMVNAGDYKYLSSAVSPHLTPELIQNTYKHFVDFTNAVPSTEKSAILFEPVFPGAFAGIKDTDSAYPHSKANHFILQVPRWTDVSQTESVREWMRKGDSILRQGNEDKPLYSNFAIYDEPIQNLFRGNLERLIQIKEKYDPDCLFNRGFVIPTQSCGRCQH